MTGDSTARLAEDLDLTGAAPESLMRTVQFSGKFQEKGPAEWPGLKSSNREFLAGSADEVARGRASLLA